MPSQVQKLPLVQLKSENSVSKASKSWLRSPKLSWMLQDTLTLSLLTRSSGCLPDYLTYKLTYSFTHSLTVWLTDWLTDLFSALTCWLSDLQTDCFTLSLTHSLSYSLSYSLTHSEFRSKTLAEGMGWEEDEEEALNSTGTSTGASVKTCPSSSTSDTNCRDTTSSSSSFHVTEAQLACVDPHSFDTRPVGLIPGTTSPAMMSLAQVHSTTLVLSTNSVLT